MAGTFPCSQSLLYVASLMIDMDAPVSSSIPRSTPFSLTDATKGLTKGPFRLYIE